MQSIGGSARMAKNSLKAVLLDVDGTLIDSNDAHAHAWVEALAEFGHHVEFQRTRDLIGTGGDKLLPELTGIEKESPQGKQISERRTDLFKQRYLPTLKPFPAARALLEALRELGLKLVVASSASSDELGELLEVAGVDDLIERKTSSSDAKESKPDPDIVEAAVASAGCSAEEAVMRGDTPYDVMAASRAGVAIVALRCGGWDDEALRGAVAIYDDPQDLLARLESSPFRAADAA
jgi:HAD superfamily hydrolase (TIGR01549 family)